MLTLLVFSRSVVSDSFSTAGTAAHQAPQPGEFSQQEYWSGLPFPSPGDLPDPGVEPASPALAGGFFTPEPLLTKRGLVSRLWAWLTGWCRPRSPLPSTPPTCVGGVSRDGGASAAPVPADSGGLSSLGSLQKSWVSVNRITPSTSCQA